MFRRIIPAVLLALVLVFTKDLLVQSALLHLARAAQVPLTIERFRMSFLGTWVTAKGLILRNPAGFPEGEMLAVNKLHLNLRPGSTLFRHPHFKSILLDIQVLRFVKNEKGEMNLTLLKFPEAPLTVDELELKLEEVMFEDYTKPLLPVQRRFEVKIHETDKSLENLKDLNGILNWVIFKAVRNAALTRYFNWNPAEILQEHALDMFMVTSAVAGKVAGAVKAGATLPLPVKDTEAKIVKAEVKTKELKEEITAVKSEAEMEAQEAARLQREAEGEIRDIDKRRVKVEGDLAGIETTKQAFQAGRADLEETEKALQTKKRETEKFGAQAERWMRDEKQQVKIAETAEQLGQAGEEIEKAKEALKEAEATAQQRRKELEAELKELDKAATAVSKKFQETEKKESGAAQALEKMDNLQTELQKTQGYLSGLKEETG